MKVAVIGSGGREHAIVKKLKESSKIDELFVLPGNGGIAADATCVNIPVTDIAAIVEFIKDNGIDFAVVTPDDPLVAGMVDAINAVGVPCFGPDKKAAIIEGSKVFSKDLMKKYNIPTAAYEVFTDMDSALSYLENAPLPAVIKADGLALGKGVVIAETKDAAKDAVKSMMADKIFGDSGNQIVIEEFLTGPEVSVLAFTDGKTLVPMVSAMDHKRALDNDKGLNTGGMGTVAPNPYYNSDVAKICMDTIFMPTIKAMESEGRTFKGCLFFGLMITPNGPKVIEYNCRFGDPETQVVLPLLDSDLFDIMMACSNGTLDKVEVNFKDSAACCVIMASNGYPQKYQRGFPITVDSDIDATLYYAGAKINDGVIVSAGGRVVGVTAVADNLQNAIKKAYTATEKVHFENAYKRSDIGKRALAAIITED
ncbi:MAG: phosphoribosylamine--glycine ligase [Clostridia bacterium]|nr:phosphoribosylamine--glycine ligase [Clostridia bacterium]